LFERLCAALAGRCAEELIFGDITSGALDDLEKATKQAYIMVSQLGFSPKLENISYYDSAGTYENSLTKPFSESTSKLIDEEVRMLLAEAKTKNMEILKLERLKLGVLAELLLKKEEVYQNELIEILGNRVEKTNKLSKNIAV
jgi:cell division protease FtsH